MLRWLSWLLETLETPIPETSAQRIGLALDAGNAGPGGSHRTQAPLPAPNAHWIGLPIDEG